MTGDLTQAQTEQADLQQRLDNQAFAADVVAALDEVKAEVDRITTFPKEAEKPIVREVTRRR